MKVPVLFIIFNRSTEALNSFSSIKKYQPDKLYIAADGPRNSNESNLCKETRENILNEITWNCEIKTLFRENNWGVDKNVYSAINWFFESEPWGIIIEDDCFLNVDFFRFCEDAFVRYKDNHNVVHIGANNIFEKQKELQKSDFGDFPYSWGWGTWKRAWNEVMDLEMNRWKTYKIKKAVSDFGFFRGIMLYKYWQESYKNREKIQTWDSIWQFSVMSINGLCLMTESNLAINYGIGTSEGTHYKKGDKNFFEYLKLDELGFPIEYPRKLVYNLEVNKLNNRYFLKLRLFGLKQKLLKIFKR